MRRINLVCALALLVSACGETDGAEALFEVPRGGVTPSGYYGLPFPNDLRLRSDGTIDLDQHIRPNALLEMYIDIVAQSRGFGTNSAGFFRFADELDPSSLPPDPFAALEPTASAYLVDVDPDSPERGARIPLRFQFESWEGESIGPNRLGCLPYPGYPLRALNTYAFVVTRRVRDADGNRLSRSADMDAVLDLAGGDAAAVAARTVYQPLIDWLDEPGGDEREDIAAAAVFTTQDPTSLIGKAREVIHRDVAAPVPANVVETETRMFGTLYEGTYQAPNFQSGTPPYSDPEDGGAFVIDPSTGEPEVQRMETLRFALSIPPGPVPSAGWPIVLYAHGTSGDYRTFWSNGTAARMSVQGLAVISIDQPLHGNRAGDERVPDEDLVFNYRNPLASRDGIRQGAIDDFQLARLVGAVSINGGGQTITLDESRMSFMGHSQGGITGSLFVPYEPMLKGAVLSGAGGLLYQTMLHKPGIPELVAAIIRDWPLDQFNNLLALVQLFGEPADPINYGPLMIREPPPGNQPKDIYQSEGFTDGFTPLITIEALGVSIGAAQVTPLVATVDGFALRGIDALDPPVSANLDGTTAVFLQYQSAAGADGHFVVFDDPAARRQHAEFLGTLARDGRATLVP